MTVLPPLVAMVVGLAVTRGLVWLAPKLSLVDIPNERSLHSRPRPTVGGLGVLAGVFAAVSFSSLMLGIAQPLASFRLCLAGGCLLILIGDEKVAMSWVTKLGIQVAATIVLVWGMVPVVTLPFGLVEGLAAIIFAALVLVYTQNIYNFMDGLDGLSGLTACVSGGMLYALYLPVYSELSVLCLSIGTAAFGFVVWNLPPARIFMGDVGSHFLGLAFAWTALSGEAYGVPFYIGILPLGAFLFDATYTIIRRLGRAENVTRAHRFHLYQRLHRSGSSALAVDGVYVVWTVLFGATAISLSTGSHAMILVPMVVILSVAITVVTEIRWTRKGEST